MLITTTPSVDGRRITRYCGVVAGEVILGANLFRDLFAGVRDLVGGRFATWSTQRPFPSMLCWMPWARSSSTKSLLVN